MSLLEKAAENVRSLHGFKLLAGKRVLLVENSARDRLRLKAALEELGAMVNYAASGKQCVDVAINAEKECSPFDVFIINTEAKLSGIPSWAKIENKDYLSSMLSMAIGQPASVAAEGRYAYCVRAQTCIEQVELYLAELLDRVN